MKASDAKVLMNIAMTLARQIPKVHLIAIEEFVLGLHRCSVKINSLNYSYEAMDHGNLGNISIIKKIVADREISKKQARKYCEDFNKFCIEAGVSSQFAMFSTTIGNDARYHPLVLVHPSLWNDKGAYIPCSQ